MSKKLLFNLNKGDIQNYTYVKYNGNIVTATNTLNKPIKSAILKGQTLVNLAKDVSSDNGWTIYGDPTLSNNTVNYVSDTSLVRYCRLKLPTKNYTTYTMIATIKCSHDSTNHPNRTIGIEMESMDGGSRIYAASHNGDWSSYTKVATKITTQTHNSVDFTLSARGLVGTMSFKEIMILEGDYTDIDIPYFEGMASCKMPVLTTSSEDGSKTNILSVSSDLTLRSKGITFDELNILTGKLTQRIDEGGEILNEEIISFVELTITDQDNNIINQINSFDNTTHIITSSDTIPPIFEGYIATKESVE